jgi:dTDP-4-amino-4,6-dideoxygalactose transaminase
VIIDLAQAVGASHNGKMSGEFADFTTFSFHEVKKLPTAEGGAITWKYIDGIDTDFIYRQYRTLSLHGQSKDAFKKSSCSWEYDIVYPGYKCNMTDITAAIGLKQLERFPQMIARRKEIITKYDNAFKEFGIKILEHYGAEFSSSGHLYLTRIPNITKEQRNEIIIEMSEYGIDTNVHYKPLPMMTAYMNLGFDIKNYPNAYKQFENEITLPLYSILTDDDVDYIIDRYSFVLKKLMCC